MTGETVHCNDG